MTEQKWLKCTDPAPMWDLVFDNTTDRKLRLYCIACCKRIQKLHALERCDRAVEIAEQCAEGILSPNEAFELGQKLELFASNNLAPYLREEISGARGIHAALNAFGILHGHLNLTALATVARNASDAMILHTAPHLENHSGAAFDSFAAPFRKKEQTAHAELVRDIIGNPFRPLTFDARWRTSTVIDLAFAIYDQRAFDRMPILADALMDAGCESEEMISHCRGEVPHIRGCWLVDLLLSKSRLQYP